MHYHAAPAAPCLHRYAPKRRLHVRACICVGACMKKKNGPFSYENRLQGLSGGCDSRERCFFFGRLAYLGSYSQPTRTVTDTSQFSYCSTNRAIHTILYI